MAVTVRFNEGADRVLAPGGGLPATSTFALDLSPIAVDLLNPDAGDLFADSGYADAVEANWTGYARIDVATPAPANGIVTYPAGLIDWETLTSADGPPDVKTLILLDDALSMWLFAWDIRSMLNSGNDLDMSAPNARILVNADFHLFLS